MFIANYINKFKNDSEIIGYDPPPPSPHQMKENISALDIEQKGSYFDCIFNIFF